LSPQVVLYDVLRYEDCTSSVVLDKRKIKSHALPINQRVRERTVKKHVSQNSNLIITAVIRSNIRMYRHHYISHHSCTKSCIAPRKAHNLSERVSRNAQKYIPRRKSFNITLGPIPQLCQWSIYQVSRLSALPQSSVRPHKSSLSAG